MSNNILFLLLGVSLTGLAVWVRRRFAGFSAQTKDDYSDDYPVFDIRKHLNGEMVCDGVIFGPMGRVTSTFTADFHINWDGETGTMKEHFVYNDRSTQHREWTLLLNEKDGFEALAEDVQGKGQGVIAGPAVLFHYPITLPKEAGGHTLRAFDCMYLTPNGTIVNRSQFRKFGFKVAELVATIRKKETT